MNKNSDEHTSVEEHFSFIQVNEMPLKKSLEIFMLTNQTKKNVVRVIYQQYCIYNKYKIKKNS